MDAPEVSVGNTLYLPVNVAGALFYFGDGHAAMGDGEIGGTAIEVPMHARLRFHVIKHSASDWPRWENQNELMAAAISPSPSFPFTCISRNSIASASPGSAPSM